MHRFITATLFATLAARGDEPVANPSTENAPRAASRPRVQRTAKGKPTGVLGLVGKRHPIPGLDPMSIEDPNKRFGNGDGIRVSGVTPPAAGKAQPAPSTIAALEARLTAAAQKAAPKRRLLDEPIISDGEPNPAFSLRLEKGHCYRIVMAADPMMILESAHLDCPEIKAPVAHSIDGASLRACGVETHVCGLMTVTHGSGRVAVNMYRD